MKNVSKRFFSETTWIIESKLPRNDHWKVLYIVCVFYAGHSWAVWFQLSKWFERVLP
jgi:hypothetical protein